MHMTYYLRLVFLTADCQDIEDVTQQNIPAMLISHKHSHNTHSNAHKAQSSIKWYV